jgi:hypothetical protein
MDVNSFESSIYSGTIHKPGGNSNCYNRVHEGTNRIDRAGIWGQEAGGSPEGDGLGAPFGEFFGVW